MKSPRRRRCHPGDGGRTTALPDVQHVWVRKPLHSLHICNVARQYHTYESRSAHQMHLDILESAR